MSCVTCFRSTLCLSGERQQFCHSLFNDRTTEKPISARQLYHCHTARCRFSTFRGRKTDPIRVPFSGPRKGPWIFISVSFVIRGSENGPYSGSGIRLLQWVRIPPTPTPKNDTHPPGKRAHLLLHLGHGQVISEAEPAVASTRTSAAVDVTVEYHHTCATRTVQ